VTAAHAQDVRWKDVSLFPLTIDGEFEHGTVRTADVPVIATRVGEMMAAAHATDVAVSQGRVTFRGRLFWVRTTLTWDYLQFVGTGEIDIRPGDPGVVTYSFSRTRPMLIVLGIMLAMSLWDAFVNGEPHQALNFFLFAVFVFGVLFYAIDAVQLGRLVKHAAGPAEHPGAQPDAKACPDCGMRFDPADYREGVMARCERCGSVLPLGDSAHCS
jgi:hypothetical protein